MSPKKQKRPSEAQNLIDSLLDESAPSQTNTKAQGRPSSSDSENDIDFGSLSEVTAEIIQLDERSSLRRTGNTSPDLRSGEVAEIDPGQIGDDFNLKLEDSGVGRVPDPTTKAMRVAEIERTRVLAETAAHVSPSSMVIETPTDTKDLPRMSDAESGEHEPTVRLGQSEIPKSAPTYKLEEPASDPFQDSGLDRLMPTEIKTGLKAQSKQRQAPEPMKSSIPLGSAFSSAEATLKQSESLRIAQSRITELEQELERLRRENEQLSTAGETLRRRTDELLSKTENMEIQLKEAEKIHDEEKKVFRGQLQQKDREALELRGRIEEMEGRLESNFKKIRVRERELEHRLEIIKMESATLVSTKDKMILELKRQIDQLRHENDFGKQKAQELFSQFKDKQDTIRRVVRALRIALTILEGDEDSGASKKGE
jgi:hypothetical protein